MSSLSFPLISFPLTISSLYWKYYKGFTFTDSIQIFTPRGPLNRSTMGWALDPLSAASTSCGPINCKQILQLGCSIVRLPFTDTISFTV